MSSASWLHGRERYKTVFYAHEVATARLLVEEHGGHDTRFYNALRLGMAQGNRMDEVFGDQSWFFKHVMIHRAGVCNRLFAVGDLVVDELRFLGGVFSSAGIDLVYNGVPAAAILLEQKLASRELLLKYAGKFFGYRPNYVFTHVSRMVPSKAYWRDIRVLEHPRMDAGDARPDRRALRRLHRRAHGPPPDDVYRWEWEYGWPVGHHADNGDLRASSTVLSDQVASDISTTLHADTSDVERLAQISSLSALIIGGKCSSCAAASARLAPRTSRGV